MIAWKLFGEDLLTPKEAAKYLNIPPSTLQGYLRAGTLQWEKTTGNRRAISVKALNEILGIFIRTQKPSLEYLIQSLIWDARKIPADNVLITDQSLTILPDMQDFRWQVIVIVGDKTSGTIWNSLHHNKLITFIDKDDLIDEKKWLRKVLGL